MRESASRAQRGAVLDDVWPLRPESYRARTSWTYVCIENSKMQRGKVSDDHDTAGIIANPVLATKIEFGLTGDIALQIISIVDEIIRKRGSV